MPLDDPLAVVKRATTVFDRAGIEYLVGGSLASSLYGIPRATQDVDIVADLTGQNLGKILPLLNEFFYTDSVMAEDAVRRGTCFNIIDREFLYKIDLFVLGDDPLSRQEMQRRIRYRLAGTDDQTIFLCSPEDIIAHKLFWYKLGNEVSERQWNDAANVVKVQAAKLDMEYLRKMCAARGVSGHLGRLLAL